MNFLPCPAKLNDVLQQFALEGPDLTRRSAVIFPKLDGTAWTVQSENRFALAADYVNVSRPMVVGIDYNSKSVEPKNCRHEANYIMILSG
jgi:hypothetical protein